LYRLCRLSVGHNPTYADWQSCLRQPPKSIPDRSIASASGAEYNSAIVAICYFDYLKRDPDPVGYQYWLRTLADNGNDLSAVVTGFISAREYRLRFGQP
jgi:Domain of unknown function (DUF4214)